MKGFKNYKYTAYMASGEIMECDDFRTIYDAAKRRARDDAMAGTICRNTDNKVIAYMLHIFGLYKMMRPDEIHPNLFGLVKQTYMLNEDGAYCWRLMGLD